MIGTCIEGLRFYLFIYLMRLYPGCGTGQAGRAGRCREAGEGGAGRPGGCREAREAGEGGGGRAAGCRGLE